MLPAILGLGGLTAKIIATAVIPRVVRAISQSFSATRPAELCPSPAVEGISSGPEPAPAPVLSGVSATRIKSRKWGYAGLWHHAPSGLDLATYRLYDAKNKRWISRDPLGEGMDRTLYSYGWNNPISNIDPEGLDSAPPGMDPIEFRKGRNKKSKVKSVCAKETLEVTAMLGAAAITAAEWTLLGIDAAAYYQMTRGGGGSPAPVPAGRPNLGSFPRENNNIRTTTLPTSGHHANQLNPNAANYRGWSQSSIDAVVNRPAATGSTINAANGNPATAYFNESGQYIVRDNVTGGLIQQSNRNDPGWIVDSNIRMNP